MKIWIVIILTGILTQLFRVFGAFIKLPRNKFMDKFLEAIPISVLIILFFPDLFISIGTKGYEIAITTTVSLLIVFLTIKKWDLGKIMLVSVSLVILANVLLSKIF